MEYVFPMHNVRFIAINDHIDSITERSKNDSIMLPFKNIMNDAYSSDISIKVRSQFEVKRKNGECVAAFVPYGYGKKPENKHCLSIDKSASAVVKDIFKWKLNGFSQKYIVEKLNSMGVLAPSDYKASINPHYHCNLQKNERSLWTATTVNTILKNQVYLGHLIQGKSTTPNVKLKKIMKLPPEQWLRVENTHEAIISEQDFWLAQKLLKMDTRVAPEQNEIYPLSAFVYCGDCGQSMNRKMLTKKAVKYQYYVCRTYGKDKTACSAHLINAQKLEEIVFICLISYLKASTNIQSIGEEVMKNNCTILNEEKERWNRHLKKNIDRKQELQALSSQLYEDFLEELITQEEYKELAGLYNRQIQGLSDIIAATKESSSADISERYEGLLESLSGRLIPALTRALVIRMIDSLKVYTKNHIKIIYRFEKE